MKFLEISFLTTTALATCCSFLTTHYIKLIKERDRKNEKN